MIIISVLIDFASTRQHELHHAPSIHQTPLVAANLAKLYHHHYQEDGWYNNNTTPLSDDNIAIVK